MTLSSHSLLASSKSCVCILHSALPITFSSHSLLLYSKSSVCILHTALPITLWSTAKSGLGRGPPTLGVALASLDAAYSRQRGPRVREGPKRRGLVLLFSQKGARCYHSTLHPCALLCSLRCSAEATTSRLVLPPRCEQCPCTVAILALCPFFTDPRDRLASTPP